MSFKNEELTDSCLMPFGEHKGKEMEQVPAQWLMWFWGKNKLQYKGNVLKPMQFRVCEYIEDNLDVLKMELKKK